jgi:hypothetical protein
LPASFLFSTYRKPPAERRRGRVPLGTLGDQARSMRDRKGEEETGGERQIEGRQKEPRTGPEAPCSDPGLGGY